MSVPQSAVERIDPYRVRVLAHTDAMRVEARVYADKALWKAIRKDATVEQIANVTSLPGVVEPALCMPDAHQGYGFPIGGVAATDVAAGGVISPGGVGFDINCGVRLLATDLSAKRARKKVPKLIKAIFQRVPVGFGRNKRALAPGDMDRLLVEGAGWAVERGWGTEHDLTHTEERGAHPLADPDEVGSRARQRGASQVGTLGSGNHFVEVQLVDAILEPDAARACGLHEGQLVVLIHTGSRGFGHQICSDHVAAFKDVMKRHDIRVADRQLACAPVSSDAGRRYLGAMAAAANYAWANRQVITHRVRESLDAVYGDVSARVVYDVAHNLAKLEEHVVDGQARTLCVHRKGATRAFPPGHPDLPATYQGIGQPVFIPGSMGTASYVLVGTQRAMDETFGSVCHGAGRVMSRTKARKTVRADDVRRDLDKLGITIMAGSKAGIVEEFPGAYKDVHNVIDVVAGAGLARPVARLKPLGVVKG